MNYQFIVVSVNEQRKKIMEEQFTKLDKKYKVIFIEGFTPSNSEEYLSDISNDFNKREACCTRSHLKALQIAGNEESLDFSIILEDDVAFHKTQFINVIEEFIKNWEEKVYPSKMISLGWVPIKNYSEYLNRPSVGSIKSILGSKIFDIFRAVGLQCYMVRKKDTKIITDFFLPTYKEIKLKYLDFVSSNSLNKDAIKHYDVIPADYFINWVLDHKILFPPIAMEKVMESTISNSTKNYYHNIFFEGYENIKDDYFLE
jgi:GR25 family glycosyltransferase involved in LPS biosynthesis